MVKKAGNLFTTAYLLLIFGVYPFYMKQGYVDIGKAKYHFFLYCSLSAIGILTLIGIVRGVQTLLLWCRQKSAFSMVLTNLSLTDMFVVLYATELFLSFVYSDYRQEALWGTEGWFMGLFLLLILCSLYFLISRLWTPNTFIGHVGLAVSGIVFILGILDRFSVYLIPLEIRQPSFISTLGNINWFCGYLSVLAPLGICPLIFYGQDIDFKKRNCFSSFGRTVILVAYTILAFTAGFCQGSNSIFLFWGALLFILLWLGALNKLWLINCFLPVSLWCFSAQLVRILLFLFPEGYNYETDNLCLYLAKSNDVLLFGVITLILFLFLRKNVSQQLMQANSIPNSNISAPPTSSLKRNVHIILIISLAIGFFLWLLLSVINTKKGIPYLSQSNLFLLNTSWGNGRGATLKTGWDLFRQMPFSQKILGVGPDCFSSLAYSMPEVAARLNDAFEGSRLTNAHNEVLTCLVNTGLAGTFLYLGILFSFMRRCLKNGTKYEAMYPLAACIFCYLAHNLVSFSHVLNLPFVFLIMGMGEAIIRHDSVAVHCVARV